MHIIKRHFNNLWDHVEFCSEEGSFKRPIVRACADFSLSDEKGLFAGELLKFEHNLKGKGPLQIVNPYFNRV